MAVCDGRYRAGQKSAGDAMFTSQERKLKTKMAERRLR